MTSLVGCSGEGFASILRSLGYASEQRKGFAITLPVLPLAATAPAAGAAAEPDAVAASSDNPDTDAGEPTDAEEANSDTAAPQLAEIASERPGVVSEIVMDAASEGEASEAAEG